ncbi:MAG: tyrosine-type recombinase/integrase [Deferrisomatales bacterium]
MAKDSVHLTKRAIDGFEFEGEHDKARDVRWSDKLPGFGVRVLPSGKKTFVLFYRTTAGQQRLMTLGTYGAPWTLDQAEKEAKKLLAAVAAGADPLREKKQAREGVTVAELAKHFLSDFAEVHLKPRTVGEYKRQLDTHIRPRWGRRLAKSIRREDVSRLHREVSKKAPFQANRTVMLVAAMFREGKREGLLPEGSVNPAHDVRLHNEKERKRDRFVKEGELPSLVQAINEHPSPYVRGALWLYILTGARKTELLCAKWEDVDLELGVLRFPAANTKARRVHHIPLSAAALAILADLPRMEGNPYVFPGGKAKQHLVNIDQPWRLIRDRATVLLWARNPKVAAIVADLREAMEKKSGEPAAGEDELWPTTAQVRAAAPFDLTGGVLDLWLHDLRRTVGSWLATAGESLPLIGKVLNHADVKTTAIYARIAEDPARRAMEEHGQRIVETAQGLRVVK